jgi:hypothetical protein
MREFKLLRGYQEINPLTNIDWSTINRINDLNTIVTPYTPHWNGINYTPTWVTNPGYIIPQPYTITTTPGYGTFTIPSYGTITTGTITSSTLTTSNPNGITYTTGGFGGTLTTGTANTFYTSNIK